MKSYEAYRTTVELTETSVEIHRVGMLAKAVAPLVSVPLNSIVALNFAKATAVANGTLQLVLKGHAPGKPQPSDPYTVLFRKKQADGMEELRTYLAQWVDYNLANPESVAVVDRTVGKLEARVQRDEDRRVLRGNTFEGIHLADGIVKHKDGGGPVAGATAMVDTAGEIRRQITVSRIVLTGVFALRWRKKIDERELYLLINGIGWAIAVPVPPKKGAEARAFAAQINAAGSTSAQPTESLPAAAEPSPVEQIEQLAGLRDRGVLSDAEFEAKKQELLDRI